MRYILIVTMSVSILFSGCSEKPERQAAKDIRKSAEKARNTISESKRQARDILRQSNAATPDGTQGTQDPAAKSQEDFNKAQAIIRDSFEEARLKIENSLKKNNRKAGKYSTPAIIANGNILFSQALNLQSTLAIAAAPLDLMIDDISKRTIIIGDLSTSKALREKLIIANEKELQQLTNLLNKGTDSYPGLKEQLKTEEAKLAEISNTLRQLESVAKNAADTANNIEKSAAEKLRLAEGLSGDEKLALQNEAYDLQLSKTEHSIKLQSTNDKIAVLNSSVSIITPTINKLVSDIGSVKQAIEKLIGAEGNAKLSANLKAIENKSNEHKDSIKQNLGNMNSALATYLDSLAQVTDLLDQAQQKYKSVKSNTGRQTAQSRQADCLLWKAGLYAESMRLQKNLSSRIKSIVAVADSSITGNLSGFDNKVSTGAAEHTKKSFECYDLAIAEYENAGGGGDFGCAVLKCQILALYGKMALADYLADTAVSDAENDKYIAIAVAASDKTNELIKKAAECDPGFSRSITNRMLDGEIDYRPRLRVDMEGYYKEVSKDFQSWNKLKGEAKKDKVTSLLQVLQDMEPPEDQDAFDRILEPEREKLNAALKKGFDETDNFDMDTGGADPNY